MPNSRFVTSSTEGRSFDHYARLIRRFLGVPVALVSLVEADRQVFCGMAGLEEPYASTRETPLSHSFCQYVVADEKPLVMGDARRDRRLADNPAIRDLSVIAYAGWPLLDEAGTTVGSLCAIDSTPRAWTREELGILEDLAHACSAELQGMWRQAHEGENLLRTIFESVDVAIAFYDEVGQLVTANALAERAVAAAGFSLETPPYAGPHVRRSDNLTPIPFEEQVIPRALRGELENHEMEWIGPPGQQLAIVASAQRVLRGDGTLRGTLVAAHDVTELARSLRVKDEFIATVSHELRTPLTSILGYLELLTDELDPDEGFVYDTLGTIRHNANRLLKRVEQLLDAADRRRQMKPQPADLSAVSRSVANTFAEEARMVGIDLRVESCGEHWATIDAAHVEEALENLVSNALKYTPSGGQVAVTTRSGDGAVHVSVTDSGTGMTPDEVDQACDTFWRSESALKQAIQGFGLGLTLVRDIVHAHQALLTIDSTPGVGTTVTLTFAGCPVSAPVLREQIP